MSSHPGPRWRSVAAVITVVAASLCAGAAVAYDVDGDSAITPIPDVTSGPSTDSPPVTANLPAPVALAVPAVSIGHRLPDLAIASPGLRPLWYAPKTSPPRSA